MTGPVINFNNRGIIPRTIDYLFNEIQNRTDYEYKVDVYYMEIYKNSGYDLLAKQNSAMSIKDFPKVIVREDANGNMILKNIRPQPARTGEEAIDLLFIGDAAREMSNTAMNEFSSRSHCIFTLNITMREPGSDIVKVSKLNLVDLAGLV